MRWLWFYLTVGNMRVEGSARLISGTPPPPYAGSYQSIREAKRAAERLLPRCQSVTVRTVVNGSETSMRATLTRKGWKGLDMMQMQESSESWEDVLPKSGRAPVGTSRAADDIDEPSAPVAFFVILPK